MTERGSDGMHPAARLDGLRRQESNAAVQFRCSRFLLVRPARSPGGAAVAKWRTWREAENMRKASVLGVLVVAAIAMLLPQPVAAQASRPTVAILDLDFGTVQRWWENDWDIGKGIADLIVDELVNDGAYRVIERKR